MSRRYEKFLQRFEEEAQSVLRANGLPTSASKLAEKYYPSRNRLVSNSMLVVLGAYHMRKEIEKKRIHHALDRFLSICDEYLEMDMYLSSSAIDANERVLDWDYDRWLNEGKKSNDNRRKAASLKKSSTQTKIIKYQFFVNENASKIKNPTWIKLQEKTAKHFDVSSRTIRKYVANPYLKK